MKNAYDESLIVGISMIKNEDDIIEIFVRHNLCFLDYLIVLDNGSTDGSRAVLDRLMQEGLHVCVVDDIDFPYTQNEKITHLYKRVATSIFPEFILPLDADELIQSPSKKSFRFDLETIPRGGIGRYPWRTYIPNYLTGHDSFVDFAYRRKKERPQYYKIIYRVDDHINYGLNIKQGGHGVSSEHPVASVRLQNTYLAHFPIRNLNQVCKKGLLSWLAYRAMRDGCASGQGYQWREIYAAVMEDRTLDPHSLSLMALNYAQDHQWKTEIELTENIVFDPPILAGLDGTSLGLYADEVDFKQIAQVVVRNFEQYLVGPPDPTAFVRETTAGTTPENTPEDVSSAPFWAHFHSTKLFLDIPPFQYLYERFSPESVLDLGCGSGGYLNTFKQLGAKRVFGVDFFESSSTFLEKDEFMSHDLTRPLDLGSKFDLVMCLEVAEHLPDGAVETLFDTIDVHTDALLVFSAGETGQPGRGHINCKPFEAWARFLKKRLYQPMLPETFFFRCIAGFSWLRRNVIVLQKVDASAICFDIYNSEWNRLIEIGKREYHWYGQDPRVITQMLRTEIPEHVY